MKHHKDWVNRGNDSSVSARCLVYREPSRCLTRHWQLDFCIDRYEYPNKPGEMPRVLTSWNEAKQRCEAQGKRLCTDREFNFACEGPEMLPYAYGYVRDAQRCNIDKPYRVPDHTKRMLPYDECLADDGCAAELARLDQRHPIGSVLTCTSWAGVVDLNGNVNEWVNVRDPEEARKSGLKGGWWGPVRSQCRPTVTFHKPDDYGYEAGFRCCRDPLDKPPRPPRPPVRFWLKRSKLRAAANAGKAFQADAGEASSSIANTTSSPSAPLNPEFKDAIADAPGASAPSASAPSASAPSSDAPSGDAPSSDAPSSDAPSGDAPSGDAPSSDAPSGDAPSGDAPSSDAPSSDAPSSDGASGHAAPDDPLANPY